MSLHLTIGYHIIISLVPETCVARLLIGVVSRRYNMSHQV